jgi:simple sugar transport system substrate-binding protein/ribose transport system substrate-binding protein
LAIAALVGLLVVPVQAQEFKLGVIAFQMSSETHARTAQAAEAAAKAKGWQVTLLNSKGTLAEHTAQMENLIQAKVNALIVCMGKPVEAEAQFAAAKKAGIPVITIMSGTSPHALFEIQVNEYKVGAEAALYLLGQLNYQGEILTQRYENNIGTRIRGKVLDIVLSENTGVKILGSHTMAKPQGWREDVKAGMEALILKNQGKFKGIWASFDGQAFVIDDILAAQGVKKGDLAIISVDGGQEIFRRIRDPKSTLTATVAIPFERMGGAAVDAVEKIVLKKMKKDDLVKGPYLFMDAVLVDKTNVPAEGKWPW